METTKNDKYTLGNYKFLQFFAGSQDDGGDSGNDEHSDGEVGSDNGDSSNNNEQSDGGAAGDSGKDTNDEGGDGDEGKLFDKAYVQTLRHEAAKYRTERNEANQKFETFANDLKGFLEKNGVKIDSGEAKELLGGLDSIINTSKASVLSAEVERVASKHNIVDSEILMKLVDQEKLEFKDGKYTGLEEQVKAIAEAKPYLVQQTEQPTKPPVKGGHGDNSNPPHKITQAELDKMTPAEITKKLNSGELAHLLKK